MNDVAPDQARQSASQLSENIGDVLASIRKLIAQDDDAGAGAATRPVPALYAPHSSTAGLPLDSVPAPSGGTGSLGLRRVRVEAAAARRRDILAEAQALSRRSENAFGNPAAAAAGAAGFDSPNLRAASAASATASSAKLTGAMDSAPLRLSSPLPPHAFVAEGRAAGNKTAEEGSATDACMEVAPPAPRQAEITSPAAGDARAPAPLPVVEAPATPTPRLPEAEMTLACTSIAAATADTARTGAGSEPEAEREDAAGSILGVMIREVVRSELQQGGMTRDLRAMILREVAQALTAGDRGR